MNLCMCKVQSLFQYITVHYTQRDIVLHIKKSTLTELHVQFIASIVSYILTSSSIPGYLNTFYITSMKQ